MKITHERGYLIPAVNTDLVDYERCAQHLAESIRRWHPDAEITIVTRDMLPDPDVTGFGYESHLFALSPYRQTIKLESDMLAAGSVDHWWNLFEKRDLVISQGARDFYDQPTANRFYRKIFDANNLPDVYNAITYWRVSQTAQEFFTLVDMIFKNWERFKQLLKFPEDVPSTDVVYAMAAQIVGPESVTLPLGYGPTIVHMKKHIIPLQREDWTQELVWELVDDTLRINTVTQHGFFHYHIKDWLHG